MRFMAEIAPARFGPIAEGYGIPFDPENPKPAALACAECTAELIAWFDVPRRLRDANVPREELAKIVDPVCQAVERSKVVDRPVTRDEILLLLDAAY
jgi:alcohol dehydrogenase class IV